LSPFLRGKNTAKTIFVFILSLWALPKAGISRPFRALILLNYYYENINDIFCCRRYFQWLFEVPRTRLAKFNNLGAYLSK
jgi:hypothetical protein